MVYGLITVWIYLISGQILFASEEPFSLIPFEASTNQVT